MLSDSAQTEDLKERCTSLMVLSATTVPLQGQRQSTAVRMVFKRMVQQPGCAEVMAYGMEVYPSVLRNQTEHMVHLLCSKTYM